MKTLKQFKEEYQIDERYDKDLDADGNGKLTKNDFKLLRAKKKKSDCMEAREDREDEEHYRSRRAKDEKAVPSEESPEEKMERKKREKQWANEGTDKPCSPYFTDSKGIKRKQPNDPFYPEFDKHEQGKTSDAKKKKFSELGLKAEATVVDRVTGKEYDPEETELDEDCGAYETWDPKHPKFVANYKKYQSDNANQGSIKDFIDKEKAKPRRLPK